LARRGRFPTASARSASPLAIKDPDGRARFREFQKKVNARMLADAGAAIRSGVLKALDVADRLAGAGR
jgi:hypothetical protein